MLNAEPEPVYIGDRRDTERHRAHLSPPALLLGGLIAQAGVHTALPAVQLLEWPWSVLGVALLAAGIALMIAGDLEFKRAGTPVRPGSPATALVTGGVFSFSRNPMYAGLVLVLYGVATLFGTLTPFLVPLVVARVLSKRFIQWEEAALCETFGQEYEDYAGSVGRWLSAPANTLGSHA